MYKKYTDVFSMDDVPEEERKEVVRSVANKIISKLMDQGAIKALLKRKVARDLRR